MSDLVEEVAGHGVTVDATPIERRVSTAQILRHSTNPRVVLPRVRMFAPCAGHDLKV